MNVIVIINAYDNTSDQLTHNKHEFQKWFLFLFPRTIFFPKI